DPEPALALRGLVARERPQIVHAHNWIMHSFLPLKPISGARLVVTLHDYGLVCATKRLMYRGMPCDGAALGRCLACARGQYGAAKGAATVVGTRLMKPAVAAMADMFLPV